MRRHIKTFLGYLLTITLIFSDLSILAYAEETTGTTENVVTSTETVNSTEEPEIISELTEKRDETTKYFAMSDGTIKACIYPQNVHYFESGKYKEIDNTLVETKEDGKTYYKNKKNDFSVKMPESFTEDYIEFCDENGYVKFKLKGATNKKIEKIEKEQQKKNTDKTVVNNVNDKAIFKSIKGNIDIEYDLSGNKLKETIILYKKSKNSFVFDVQTSVASAKVNADNSISFFDSDGTELYIIASPYMTDSAGEYSNAIETKLIKNDTGYTLTYTPDYEWLSAKEREYPVKVDPTLFKAIYKETVTDTYVSNVQSSSNPDIRGKWDVLNIGRRKTNLSSGTQLTKRGLIRFDIPSEIGKNDCIVDAKLDLVHYTVSNAVSVSGIQIDVHELTKSFTESGTWWENQPTFDPIITDYAIVNTNNKFSGSTLSYDSYNITRLVNKWHNGSSTNYGIMLKLHDEETTVTSSKQVYYFAKQSTYYGSVSKFVEITYRNATGLEDYWSYTTQEFGKYGTGYVNNYNGNLVYIHDDVSFNSLINGFTLSHVYNTNLSSTGTGYYGSGWKLNLVQKLEPITVTGNSSVKYVYTDGDGTRHYFVQNSDGKIVDEDGLGYTYSDISEGQLKRKITDKNGTILKFDSSNYLCHIIDTNGNTINLNYSSRSGAENYLSSITTSSGGYIKLNYNSDYTLSSITDNANRITTYKYESGNLTEIQYPDGTKLKFKYCGYVDGMSSSIHWLHDIIAPDGKQLRYGNYPQSGKIYSARYTDENLVLSSQAYFFYSHNQTRILDHNNKNVYYQFDTVGRATCVYDSQQNIYNQSYNATVASGSQIFCNNKLKTTPNGTVYINNLLSNGVFTDNLTDWSFYKENPDSQISIVTDKGLLTSKSVKISSEGDTIEVIIQQRPTISAERTYTLSGYLKLENVQSERDGAGIEIVVAGGSKTKYYYSNLITGTTDTEVDNGFRHISRTMTLEEGEYIERISAGLYNASGTVYIDSLQLEEGDTGNHINFVENSSFEKTSGANGTPFGFVDNYNDSLSGTSTITKYTGSNSHRICGSANENRYLLQQFTFNGKAGDVYSFGGWAKGNPAPKKENTKFNMLLRFIYVDGTSEWIAKWFNTYVADWQFVMDTVIAKKDYTSIEIYCCYLNVNTAYFDNIFLYRDTMQAYTYDNKGNVVSVSDYASQNETFQYNNNNSLAKLLNPTGSSYEYLYDSKNNITSARSAEGVAYNITYDEHGNVTNTSINSHCHSSSIQNNKIYYIRLKNSGKYLAVEGSGTAINTNVVQETFTGEDNQKWKIVQTSDGYYYLRPLYILGMSLDVSNGASGNGNIAIHTNNGSDAQKFHITPQGNYTYQLIGKCFSDKRVVSVSNSGSQNNVTITVASGTNNADQEWYLEDVNQLSTNIIEDSEIYQFRGRHSGKYLDLRNGYTDIGTLVQQYESNYTAAQKFILNQYQNTEYFTLTAYKNTERMLQISDNVNSSGYKYLQLSDNTITDDKLFKLEYNATNQGFFIIPKNNETLCLTVANSSLDNEANMIFKERAFDTSQIFIAEMFSDTITSSATYQDNGNYPHTTTDSRGNTTTYTYDSDRGLQTGVTDAKGNTIEYTYNPLNDLLESVSSGGSTVSYQYETNGALKNITTANGTTYNFVYDSFGRTSRILVGNQLLSETIYRDDYSSLVKRFNYGNGNYKTYTYDNQDRIISESINGTEIRTYVYDKNGNIAKITDHITNVTTTFRYDLIGRTVEMKTTDGQSMNFIYDKFNRLSHSKLLIDNMAFSSGYIYGDNTVDGQKTGLIYGVNLNGIQQLAYQYDELARIKNRTINTTTPYVTEYGYLEGAAANTTTTLVKTIKNGNDTLEYSYDELGNITAVAKNGTVIETYTYDSLGQLTGATYGGNTYTYSYDNGGNITEIKKNDVVIKSYTYGNSEWKDLLTAFNGEAITYDKIGNPLTYRNGLNFTWQNGRQLTSISQNGNAIATYIYDADGLRTSKTVNGATTEYYWLNGTLYGQKTGNEYLFFLYDENGTVYGFIIQNGIEKSHYYYEFNLQGDIIGIIDSTGTKVVEYTYGAWGDILSVTGTLADTIGQKNPLRYRGYYYDVETGFYLTGTRYYDPEIGRFINADKVIAGVGGDINGYNLYSYCFNNPTNMSDPTGDWPFNAISKFVKKVVSGIIVSTIVNHIVNAKNKNKINEQIQKTYTKESAKNEIDKILENYGDDVSATFNDTGVEITNSVKVKSRYDRQKISTIITRTENVTKREFDDLSAEWLFHNIAYDLHIKRDSAISANLDYSSDSRWYVVGATDLLEIFGWE